MASATLLGPDFRMARVESIEQAGRQRVWDLSVDGTHAFIADGLAVHNTPQHYDDALHRLKGKEGWRHVKYKAADFDTGTALWPERYSIRDLLATQAVDALIFSREYQMDPRDDASSVFPYPLTARALVNGSGWVYSLHPADRAPGEYIVLGGDLAVSEAVGADYTVFMVASYNRWTQRRRLIWACRERGLSFDNMVRLARDICRDLGVDIGVVEQNGFQSWAHQEFAKHPETNVRIFGHNTGVEKQDLRMGVPGIKLALENGLWEVPSGLDLTGQPLHPDVTQWVGFWRAELNAMGYVNGRLQSAGEHDDTVMATWFVERGIRMVERHLSDALGGDVVTAEDIGVSHVTIGDYQ